MSIKIHETITKLKEEEKRSFWVASMTINPNFTLMGDKDQTILRECGKYFFENLKNYMTDIQEIKDDIEVFFQLEKGDKKQSDHLQVAIQYSSTYGVQPRFDLEKCRGFWNWCMKRHYKSDRTCYFSVEIVKNNQKFLEQYVRKSEK